MTLHGGVPRPLKMTRDERAAHRAALIARDATPERRAAQMARDEATISQAVKSTLLDMEMQRLGRLDMDAVIEKMAVRRHRAEVRRRVALALDARKLAPSALPARPDYLPVAIGRSPIGYSCRYCNAPAEAIDHVWPRARGGDDHPNNLVPSCTSCNSWKGSHSWLTARCPGCEAFRDPGDVATSSGMAHYACRCGARWSRQWDLQHVPARRARASVW